MKTRDVPTRSRLFRHCLRGSLVLLTFTLIYWSIVAKFAPDFGSLDGNEKFPALAVELGHHEVAWIVDARHVLLWHAADPAGGTLPLIKSHGLLESLFLLLAFDDPAHPSVNRRFLNAGINTYCTTGPSTGSPVMVHLVFAPLEDVAILFALWPCLVGPFILWRKSRRALAARRVFRRRRIRNAMGRCVCGYDLRQSRACCPECGRAFRRVPVAMPG